MDARPECVLVDSLIFLSRIDIFNKCFVYLQMIPSQHLQLIKKQTIIIPNIAEDERLGRSFSYLIDVLAKTEAFDYVVWDFKHVSFLHPFFLAPLAIYKDTFKKRIECVNISLRLQSFLNAVCFDRMLHFNNDSKEDVLSVIAKYLNKSFFPLCSFAMTDSNKDSFGSLIQHVITKQTGAERGESSLSYLISELLDNIYEHSQSPNGYVYSQYIESEKMIYLCCRYRNYNSGQL